MTARRRSQAYLPLQIALLATLYFLTAWWGLKVGAVSVFATLVWAPTGIALAALLTFGRQLWPGIAIGAFLVNWFVGAPAFTSFGMAVGNTLEAVVAVYLLRQVHFRPSLQRLRDVFFLILLAALGSTLISATIGVFSLYVTGAVQPEKIFATWIAWWFGDILGDLLVAPFLLVWSQRPILHKVPLTRVIEIVGLMLLVIGGAVIIFSVDPKDHEPILHPYLIFPLVMLVGVRLNQKWTVTSIVAIAGIVIWVTIKERGHFWTGSLSESLLQAQTFMGILSVSKMVLAAAVMERKAREHEAYEAVRARDEFLSIASHELKTPLTSLSLRLQMTIFELNQIKGAPEEPLPLSRATADLIYGSEEQLKKLTALLDELLDLTRIRSGKMQLEKEQFDLCGLVNDVVERFRASQGPKVPTISVSCVGMAHGSWDRLRMEQVISNLLSNAIKYGEGKPVEVTVGLNGNRILLTVKDQGLGIPEDMKERIFERFERAGMSNKIAGLGLGLYICRQIIDAHGGAIWAESLDGNGTVFRVELPNT